MSQQNQAEQQKQSMVRNRKGFTMIELVIGIAVLAILGTVAIAGYSSMIADSRERAMENDLKAMGPAMSKHYADFGAYPTSINSTDGATSTATAMAFQFSNDVTITFPTAPTISSWTAQADHAKLDRTCTLTVRDFGSSKPSCVASTGTGSGTGTGTGT